jgi:FkbM family methyltransferase
VAAQDSPDGELLTLKLLQVLRRIRSRPLNRGNQFAAFLRLVRWQLAARLLPEAEFSLPFVNDSRLLMTRGMTDATGNFYCGLHEEDEMGFALHVLRRGDVFVDIGANVGSYTVLAAKLGARVVAVEPIPATFDRLVANVRLNGLESLVTAHRVGLSDRNGSLRFTTDHGTINHVMAPTDNLAGTEIEVATLDSILAGVSPALIKIDVEGHELAVLNGAGRTLASPSLLAVIMETNGSGLRYRIPDAELYELMGACGFEPHTYYAVTRELARLDLRAGTSVINTIFIARGKIDDVKALIARAPRATLINGSI